MSFHDYENRRDPYSMSGSKYGWNGGGGSSRAGWVLAVLVAAIFVLLLIVGFSGGDQNATVPADPSAPALEITPETTIEPAAPTGTETPTAPVPAE